MVIDKVTGQERPIDSAMFLPRQAELITEAPYDGDKIIHRESVRYQQSEPITFGAEKLLCVCGYITLSTCRECGSPACGSCLGLSRHAERFH